MKKALPFIIIAVLLIVIIIVAKGTKKAAVEEVVNKAPDQLLPPPPPENIAQDGQMTAVLPSDISITPPAIDGAAMNGSTCINHVFVVNMINAWKEEGLIKRVAIKQELKRVCPAALPYLIR